MNGSAGFARAAWALALLPAAVLAQPAAQDEIFVLGRWDNPFGFTSTASHGVVGAAELDARPRMRTGEVLEAVPGLIVTQHSGAGKSNQMFLRGFNLDHGTDFATWVDGMPVNLPTHGHGQGYTDLNFLIPELVERLEYRKGAYYAEVSDFSSAGGAYLTTYERLPEGVLKGGVGEDGYASVLVADSAATGAGELLYAVQTHRYDGPWVDVSEDLQRNNLLLRYSSRTDDGEWNVALMGYDAQWNAADQVPRRVVESGAVAARLARHLARRRDVALQRLGHLECGARRGPRALERLCDRLRPVALLELHVLSRRRHRRRSVRAARRSHDRGR